MSEKNFIFKFIETNKIAIQSFVQKNEYKEYDIENQRQILESLTTLQNQLNFSFQQDLKNEQDAFNYFLS